MAKKTKNVVKAKATKPTTEIGKLLNTLNREAAMALGLKTGFKVYTLNNSFMFTSTEEAGVTKLTIKNIKNNKTYYFVHVGD